MQFLQCKYGDFILPEVDDLIFNSLKIYGEWAQDELNLLSHFICSGNKIIDVGAYVGTHTRAFSNIVGPEGQVYAFEPSQSIYDILVKNHELAPNNNIKLFQQGLGSQKSTLYYCDDNSENNFGASFLTNNHSPSNSRSVEITTLDDIHFKEIDFIKVDIEGMEPQFLIGGKKTIEQCKPIIFLEVNSVSAAVKIFEWANESEYAVYGHLSSAFNPENFNGSSINIFGKGKECGLILIHLDKSDLWKSTTEKLRMPLIRSIDDLTLLLLHKPQYFDEILKSTSVALEYGIEITTPGLELCSTKIEELNHTVSNRDEHINNLNQVINEKDKQIAQLNSSLADLDKNLLDLKNSMSWRITKPLRTFSYQLSKLGAFLNVLTKKTQTIFGSQKHVHPQQILLLEDMPQKGLVLPKNIALHAHILNKDIAKKLSDYLLNFPVPFYLYLSTPNLNEAKQIEEIIRKLPQIIELQIYIFEIQGKNLLPNLTDLMKKLSNYPVILHINTHKFEQNTPLFGGKYRYLMESFLGSSDRFTTMLQQFIHNKRLGILFTNNFHPVQEQSSSKENDQFVDLLKQLKLLNKNIEKFYNQDFIPDHDMFLYRGRIIKTLIKSRLISKIIKPEDSINVIFNTLTKLLPYIASKKKLTTLSFQNTSLYYKNRSAHRMELCGVYQSKGLFKNPIILFDHNYGGGLNTYTNELLNNAITNGNKVLRVFYHDSVWFIQWIEKKDGALFFTSQIDQLFDMLAMSDSQNVIFNSIYGHPNIRQMIVKIIELTKKLDAQLDVKVHDFFALCPSPHLMDNEWKYCGIPRDLSVCNKCLPHNHHWYHTWVPTENRPTNIAQWREPFAELFHSANTVTFFDQSSVDIVQQVFSIESNKIRLIPHTINYIKLEEKLDLSGEMHIGILGSLNIVKGGNVVQELQSHIEDQNSAIPITVVGSNDMGNLSDQIRVHGPYEQKDLPEIIRKNGINVILMASIVPETFSYTISEAMQMRLPIVAFDIGAQGNRIKQYKLGKVVPFGSSPELLLRAMQSVLKVAQMESIQMEVELC